MTPTNHTQWLADRRTGIGGTDLAPILGLSNYRTPHDVWREKVLGETEPENDNMRRGKLLEPVVRAMYQDRHPDHVIVEPGHLQGTDPIIMGTPDGIVNGEFVVDYKSTRWFVFNKWDDTPPVDYWCQLQHYMYLTGCRKALLAVLVDGAELHELHVAYDAEFMAQAIPQAVAWWERHVIGKVEPERTEPVPYPEPDPGTISSADGDTLEILADLRNVRELERELKARRDHLEHEIKEYMGTAEVLVDPDGGRLATWKGTKNGNRTFRLAD